MIMDRNGKALISAAVVGIMVVVGVHYLHGRGEESPRAGCPTVVVTASVDKSDLMAEAAARYNASDRRVGADCYGISVRPMASGVAEARLAQDRWDESWGPVPDAWQTAASTWLQLLRHDRAAQDRLDILPVKTESVVSTPIVLAMPEPKARALGWPQAPIGWWDLLALAGDPAGWGIQGAPRVGCVQARQDQSHRVDVGTCRHRRCVRRGDRDLERPDAGRARRPAGARRFVAGVEKSVAHYGDTALTFLTNLQRADDAGAALGYVSAVAVEEKLVVDYNAGNCRRETCRPPDDTGPPGYRWWPSTPRKGRSTATARSPF